MDEYLTEEELCERLKLSRNSLWQLRKNGLPYRKIGGVIRYLPAEVETWIQTYCSNRPVGSKEVTNE